MPPGYQVPPGYRPPPPVAPNGAQLAGFGERLLAYVIDFAIIGAASGVVTIPAAIWMTKVFESSWVTKVSESSTGSIFVLFLAFAYGQVALVLGIMYVYRVEMMWRTGQTVGKRVKKLRVIPLQPGVRLTRGIAAMRFLIEIIGWSVPNFIVVDGLWPLWDKPFRQCLHDKLAKTVVVKV